MTALCLAAAACRPSADPPERAALGVTFPGDTTHLVRPRLFRDLSSVVSQLNAIVEGEVGDIVSSYRDCEGPRSHVRLRNVRTLLGEPHLDTLTLLTFGGQLPNGRMTSVSELPRFVPGGRYVIFLRNTDWRYSPVITNHAYRVERIAGREVLITTDGVGVTGVSARGVETRTGLLTTAAGLRISGVLESGGSTDPGAPFQPCATGPDGQPDCRPAPDPVSADASQTSPAEYRYERPAVRPGITPDEVRGALTVGELVEGVASFARDRGISVGGYYASHPRLECWRVTPTVGKGRR